MGKNDKDRDREEIERRIKAARDADLKAAKEAERRAEQAKKNGKK